MSYEIVYDRQFIKSPAGITPLVLSGSNNCTEITPSGRERRARDWGVLFGDPAQSEQDLINNAESCCDGTYQEHFVRNGKWVDDRAFLRFIRNGICKALTIEELRMYRPGTYLRCSISVWEPEYRHHTELETTVKSSEELVAWIASARERFSTIKDGESLNYIIQFPLNEPPRMSKRLPITGKVAVSYRNLYLSKIEAQTISTSVNPQHALVFESQQDALERIPSTFHHNLRFIHAETIEKKCKCSYLIRIDGCVFFSRLTSRRLKITMYADTARHFPSAKAAEAYIEKQLLPRTQEHRFAVYHQPNEPCASSPCE